MLNVGRVCVKTAGRDAMKYCVVIEEVDATYVVVDGDVRRKKVNMAHLEPLNKTIDIKAKAKTEDVKKALADAGFKVRDAKKVEKKSTKKAE